MFMTELIHEFLFDCKVRELSDLTCSNYEKQLNKFRHFVRAIPHNSARADSEKIWVLIKALFRRCTLCTSRKSDEIRAQIFQEMPKANCAVLP